MQDDGNEDVEEDGDQIRQPIVILDQLPICKDQMVGQIPTTQFPGKGLRVRGGGGGGALFPTRGLDEATREVESERVHNCASGCRAGKKGSSLSQFIGREWLVSPLVITHLK